jgi:hypothetical protein
MTSDEGDVASHRSGGGGGRAPRRAYYGSRHVPRSIWRRGLYSLLVIAAVVAFMTEGLHLIEGYSYLNAFYFTSMVATGQGPSSPPATAAGKIFVSVMAFVSTGTVITSLVFVFGPFFGALLRESIEKVEEEEARRKKTGESRKEASD